MANRQLMFGTYTFPSGIRVESDDAPLRIPAQGYPRAHGARSLTGYLDARRIILRGGIYNGPLDRSDHRTRLDALYAALAAGPATLRLYDDRHYRNAQASVRSTYGATGFGRIADVEIECVCPDPFGYKNVETVVTESVSATGETWNVTTAGNAPCLPHAIEITVGGSGAETIAFTITNTSTSESFTLAGDVTAGDIIVVNCLDRTVLIGATDKMSLFDGEWLSLAVGGNTMQEAYTASAITQVVMRWYDRYW